MAALSGADAYDAADVMGQELGGWLPQREHPDSEIGSARDAVTARARDLVRNNGFAAGGVQRETDAVIGAQFRPAAKPDWRALGIDRALATEIGEQMDAAWRTWADDPLHGADVTRTQDWGGLAGLAYRTELIDGDALAVVHWRDDSPGPFRTCLRVLDPDLLSNPQMRPDSPRQRGGIEFDAWGAPVAYHFRRQHELAMWGWGTSQVWDRWERSHPWGRPQIVHCFERHRDGQTRGISRLAPVLDALKMQDKHARVELQAAVLGAILGLFISSPLSADAVQDLISDGGYTDLDTARQQLAKERGLTLGGVRVPVLPPGDSIESVSVSRPAGQYAMFETAVLRRIATGMGMSYEQLAMDWSQVNYSSARAALVEIWRGFAARRREFAARFCQPVRLAVIEEAIDLGLVHLPKGAPTLYQAPGAWLRAKWIGPGRGYVDPVKEAQASAIRVALGLSTMEDEAAELSGADYGDNLAQIAREIEQMPAGVLHPAQEKFATIMGVTGPDMRAPADG
jgi:lambda family phage portal protein